MRFARGKIGLCAFWVELQQMMKFDFEKYVNCVEGNYRDITE